MNKNFVINMIIINIIKALFNIYLHELFGFFLIQRYSFIFDIDMIGTCQKRQNAANSAAFRQ